MRTATAAANRPHSASHGVSRIEASRLGWSHSPRATIPTASSSAVATLLSFTACCRRLACEIPGSSTTRPGKRPEPVSLSTSQWSGSGMGEPLSGSAENPKRCGNHTAQLCVRSAPFSALVGGGNPNHGDHGEDAHRIHLARLHSLPNQSAAATCRRQYQPQRGYRGTCVATRLPPRTDSFRPRLSVRLLAPPPPRHGTTAPSLEPLTREDTQTRHRPSVRRRGSPLLGQFPHLPGSGHRRFDAPGWPALL